MPDTYKGLQLGAKYTQVYPVVVVVQWTSREGKPSVQEVPPSQSIMGRPWLSHYTKGPQLSNLGLAASELFLPFCGLAAAGGLMEVLLALPP